MQEELEKGWNAYKELFFKKNPYPEDQAAVVSKILREAFENGFRVGQHAAKSPVSIPPNGTTDGIKLEQLT